MFPMLLGFLTRFPHPLSILAFPFLKISRGDQKNPLGATLLLFCNIISFPISAFLYFPILLLGKKYLAGTTLMTYPYFSDRNRNSYLNLSSVQFWIDQTGNSFPHIAVVHIAVVHKETDFLLKTVFTSSIV